MHLTLNNYFQKKNYFNKMYNINELGIRAYDKKYYTYT